MNYTTQPQMSEQVNNLLLALEESRLMAIKLYIENLNNHLALLRESDDAMNEQRPLSWEERVSEAAIQADLFLKAADAIATLKSEITLKY